ncbi:hypothetical protein TRFO_28128 [Tritrichomonas foetus]|uniref:Uncharacterized protein n=1 Tax=Tritrichomonas foetus TaxID=1144522 RepID=A0A1J4JYX2_9EUKA|nr:hypothetical protein TRFO_28128 [Tritrichomonas foetus]|eukprot:OHT04367.1 hypothetical protein TRFO_28128 [Tritrichomonas foetus]
MEDFVFRDGYLLRLYSQRGPHAYYRCSNRKNKCKVRLSINHLTQTENISGEHLDSCVRDITQNPATVRRRKAPIKNPNPLQHLQNQIPIFPQIDQNLLENIALIPPALFPDELRQTIDRSQFLQLISVYPSLSVVLFTKEMSIFAPCCNRLIFELSQTFYQEPFHYLLIIFGYYSPIEIKPIAFFLLQDCEPVELSTLFNFLKGSFNLSNIATIYTRPEASLLDFSFTQTQNVRMTFFHMRELVSKTFSPEITDTILQISMMSRNDADHYIQNLRDTEPDSQVLAFYDQNLAARQFEFWNVSDDLDFHKAVNPILTELKNTIDGFGVDPQHSIVTFARNLQQLELQLRNIQTTANEELLTPKSIDDIIFGGAHIDPSLGDISIPKEHKDGNS